jgi:hypothetical protein
VYTTGKADIGSITTTNLAIGKSNTINALDVNGSAVISGKTKTNGLIVAKDLVDPYYTLDVSGNSSFSGDSFEVYKLKNDYLHGFSSNTPSSGKSFFDAYHQQYTVGVDMNQIDNYFTLKAQTPSALKTYINLNYNQGNVNVEPVLQLYRPIVLEAPSSDLSIPNKAYIDANTMTSSSNQTITGQKTFSQPYQDIFITNPYMRDFTNNGFTAPTTVSPLISIISTAGAYSNGYSNWTFVSGAGVRTNQVDWFYGSSNILEWTQIQIVGAPPSSNPSVFSGNYALAFSTYAPTQSFYTQLGVVLPTGYYTMTFYSYFGSSPYGGGYIGSTSASITISVDKSPDTLNYSDPETRVKGAWKLRTFNFQVTQPGFATYIRWTPNESQSALYMFRWALAGISIRRNNGNFFTDASGTTLVGGNYSLLQNPVLNNPIAQGTLTCQGIPQFSLKTGASNLVLNTDFNTSSNNVNNVAVGWGLASNPLMINNTIVGSYSGGTKTSLVDCSIYGYYNSGLNRDTVIGSYLRCVDASYNFNGYNVLIGSYIGVDPGGNRNPTQGASKNCVFIGNEIASGMYNGFGKNPYSPSEAIAIGYRSQNLIWDNSNCSVGPYTLEKADGNNNTDTGQGYLRTTQANSAFGYGAGRTPRNTHCSTYIGMNADFSGNSIETTPVHFSTAIGANAKVRASYATALGAYVYNDVSNSIRIGRPEDITQIDGSLNVLKGVNITGDLVVSGSTTFTSLPTCSATVSSSNQLTNKTYVDNEISWLSSDVSTLQSKTTYISSITGIPTGTTYISSTLDLGTNSIKAGTTTISSAQLSYLSGASSNIQNQLNAKQASGSYAVLGSSNVFTSNNSFTVLPTCSATVGTGVDASNQLVNRKYVDSKVAPLSAAALLDGANTFSALNVFNTYAPQTDTDPSVANDLVRKSWIDSNFVALSGGQTIIGSKTFTKAIVCNEDPINGDELTRKSWVDTQLATKQPTGTYLTTNTAQTVSALKTFTASVKIGSGGYAPPTDCLFIGQHNSYRKIILHSINDNEFQNYSIGTNVINEEMVFMIPGITRTFKFCNASGMTSKNDLFTLGKNFGASLSVELTLPSMVLSSGNRYGGWNTTALDLSGSLLQVEQMNVANASTGSITGATTISKPFNQYHAVEATGTAFTITLPEITSKEMGKEIVFRKVKQTGTLVSITFAGNGTQKVYNTQLTGVNTNALMTSSVYIVRLVALLDATSGSGVYGWFQV